MQTGTTAKLRWVSGYSHDESRGALFGDSGDGMQDGGLDHRLLSQLTHDSEDRSPYMGVGPCERAGHLRIEIPGAMNNRGCEHVVFGLAAVLAAVSNASACSQFDRHSLI